MEPSAVHAMKRHETVRVLVSAILQSGTYHSIISYCILGLNYFKSISFQFNNYFFCFTFLDEFSDVNGHKEVKLSEGKGYMAASIYIQDQVRKIYKIILMLVSQIKH